MDKVSDAYVISVIGEGSVFNGDLDLQGVLHINGDFYGKISTVGDVAIGITGRAQCKIHARNVVVSGTLHGQVVASGSVHLNNSAVVLADIETATLNVEPQAIIRGKMRTRDFNQKAARINPQTVGAGDSWPK